MSPFLSFTHVSFTLPDGRTVLEDVTFGLGPGRHGIVGANGSGKSTLLRLATGALRPTAGAVAVHGRLAHLPQDLTSRPGATVADLLDVRSTLDALAAIEAGSVDPNHFDAVGDDWDLPERITARLEAAGLAAVALDRPVSSLSGGERVLLALTARLLRRPDVLLLDEPTNNLDAPTQRRVADLVSEFGGVLVVVSHDRRLLERMDQIGEVRDTAVRWYSGSLSDYEAAVEHEQQLARQAVSTARAHVRRQHRELIEQQTKQARRDRQGRGKADGLPRIVANEYRRRAQVTAGRVRAIHEDRLEESRAALEQAKEQLRDDRGIHVDLPETEVPTRRRVLRAAGLVPAHGTSRPLDLDVRGPERIAVVGPNGAGKTSLLRAILGLEEPRRGSAEVFVPWRYLPQDVDLLTADRSVLDNVRRVAPGRTPGDVRAKLARFGFRGDAVDQSVRTLSGGERWRATLAALVLATPAPQLLVLDEPTNNLDLASLDRLVEALGSHRGALLVVSHDERFLSDLDLDRRIAVDR